MGKGNQRMGSREGKRRHREEGNGRGGKRRKGEEMKRKGIKGKKKGKGRED